MTSRNTPAYVSFADAAKLVVAQHVASSMTSQGLRKLARDRDRLTGSERWPFGDARGQEPYLTGGRTRMMRTEPLLAYLRKHPPTGRGPDKQPRRRRGG